MIISIKQSRFGKNKFANLISEKQPLFLVTFVFSPDSPSKSAGRRNSSFFCRLFSRITLTGEKKAVGYLSKKGIGTYSFLSIYNTPRRHSDTHRKISILPDLIPCAGAA